MLDFVAVRLWDMEATSAMVRLPAAGLIAICVILISMPLLTWSWAKLRSVR
jgi:hypothetical protein